MTFASEFASEKRFRQSHRTSFTDLPRLRLCTSAFRFFRNAEPATEVFPKFGIKFKDAYRMYDHSTCNAYFDLCMIMDTYVHTHTHKKKIKLGLT